MDIDLLKGKSVLLVGAGLAHGSHHGELAVYEDRELPVWGKAEGGVEEAVLGRVVIRCYQWDDESVSGCVWKKIFLC